MWQHQYGIHISSTPGLRRQAKLITLATQESSELNSLWEVEMWEQPCDLNVHHARTRSYTWEHKRRDKHTHTYLRDAELRGRPSPLTDEPAKQPEDRGERRGVGLGAVLYRHASVIIQWAGRQRGCFFMKQPFPPCQASPWCKSNTTLLHTKNFFIRQSHYLLLIHSLLSLSEYKIETIRQTELWCHTYAQTQTSQWMV